MPLPAGLAYCDFVVIVGLGSVSTPTLFLFSKIILAVLVLCIINTYLLESAYEFL